MLLELSNLNSDKLPVYVSGYTPIAQFREHISIRFNKYCILIDTIIINRELIFYLQIEE